ncbi:hypothetical protein [Bradyrhizobium lablabi]|uniref:hypothetical protein n=1 Tax=Bradyrhizobium lablabi TaxID=722472 RepID=UPI00155F6B19|nr:hypothetical protein [Bradyrhizobium lablabi]
MDAEPDIIFNHDQILNGPKGVDCSREFTILIFDQSRRPTIEHVISRRDVDVIGKNAVPAEPHISQDNATVLDGCVISDSDCRIGSEFDLPTDGAVPAQDKASPAREHDIAARGKTCSRRVFHETLACEIDGRVTVEPGVTPAVSEMPEGIRFVEDQPRGCGDSSNDAEQAPML